MGKLREKYWPLIAGIGAAALFCLLMREHRRPSGTDDLLQAIVNVMAITVGFVATAKSILLSLENKRVIRSLKAIGEFETIIDYMMAAVRWAMMAACLAAAALFLDVSIVGKFADLILCAVVFVTVVAAGSCYRIIRILSKILRSS